MNEFKISQDHFQKEKNKSHYRSLRIPGYIIEAKLEIPKYPPHGLWWLSYFVDIVEGKPLTEIIRNPIWPIPKDDHIITQILYEMIDHGLIEVDWEQGTMKTSPQLTELYNKGGKKSLISQFLEFETVQGEWWIDAIGGTLLSRQSALSYDVDYSKKKQSNCLELEPEIQEQEIEDYLRVNLSNLISLLGISKLAGINLDSDRSFRKYASLSSPFKVTLKKSIQFELYGKHQKGAFRILPKNLMDLEPMLFEKVPQIFGKKIRHKPNLRRYISSEIEKFALSLEKFPNEVMEFHSKEQISSGIEYFMHKAQEEDTWIHWYADGHYVEPVVGNADIHFDVLYEILAGHWNVQKDFEESFYLEPPQYVIFTSSFLNTNNLFPEDGLIDVLIAIAKIPKIKKIVIIYGHANDDTPDQQENDINSYLSRIFQEIPELRNRLFLVPSKKRTHEKIFVFSNGAWMLGSWNATSSRPNSNQLECSIRGFSSSLATNLLEQIKKNCENPEALEVILRTKDRLNENIKKEKNQATNQVIIGKILYKLLSKCLSLLHKISNKINIEDLLNETNSTYSSIITILRSLTLCFLKKTRITMINEHQSRDLFITQTRKTRAEMFLASDRISKSALDSGFLKDFLLNQPERKKSLRILWGREWEYESNLSKDARIQLKEATSVIEKLEQNPDYQLLTDSRPMENHAKFALFDGARGLITSENILGYGGEKDKYESNELGIFIESIPTIRFIHGRAMEHRLPYFNADITHNPIAYRPYEWICEGINQYYAFQAIGDDLDFDYSETNFIKNAILDEFNPDSQFHSSNLDTFDKKILRNINKCLEKRKDLLNEEIFDHFSKKGQNFYLLKPGVNLSSSKTWIPYSVPFKKGELAQIEKILNDIEFKFHQSIKFGDKKKKDIDTYKSDNRDSDESLRSISPIVSEIMENMVLIKKGEFYMGNNAVYDERPRHKVILTQDFYIGKYPVTQKIWKSVIGSLPSLRTNERNDNAPIINVSFNDAHKFLEILNKLPGSGVFNLPTEAQWEYACRAGTTTEYYFGDNPGREQKPGKLEEFAWTKRNSGQKLREVGLKKANQWGLHDMHGLVYEHLRDHKRRYTKQTATNPIGPLDSDKVGCRGGCWKRFPINVHGSKKNEHFRSSCRTDHPKYEKSYRTGFRIIMNIPDKNEILL